MTERENAEADEVVPTIVCPVGQSQKTKKVATNHASKNCHPRKMGAGTRSTRYRGRRKRQKHRELKCQIQGSFFLQIQK